MLILSEKDIRSFYSMKNALQDMREGLIRQTEAEILNPHRTVLDIPEHEASALYMPCAMPSAGKSVVKAVTIFPHNPSIGKKTTQGVILLSDARNGDHLALLNASYLTSLRTGAISGVATAHLAREDARTVAVIGCGAMAEEQLQAVLEVREISSAILYNRTKEKAEKFAPKIKELCPDFDGTITISGDADSAAAEADIIICATRSSTPVFSGKALNPGTHINGVGSYQPHMQEVGEETLLKCSKIVADTIEGVKEEAGDLIIPANSGTWSFDQLHGELGELAAGQISGRENDQEITFFKSVGTAYFDLAIASAVYQKALELGAGTEVEI
ncbi:ornithine cyclodeaminase [Bacillus sp. OG2]|nr:ornithine cyclodeaminase [Bacillus sp. OG2]